MIADKQPFYIFSLRIIYLWIWLYPVISDVDCSSGLNLYMLHLYQTRLIDSPRFYVYLCLVFECSCSSYKHPWSRSLSFFTGKTFLWFAFPTQLLIHFLHWYSVAERRMKEGFSFGCRLPCARSETVVEDWWEAKRILQRAAWEKVEKQREGFNDSLVAHNSTTVAECWCCGKNGGLFPKTWESMATGKWPGSQGFRGLEIQAPLLSDCFIPPISQQQGKAHRLQQQ